MFFHYTHKMPGSENYRYRIKLRKQLNDNDNIRPTNLSHPIIVREFCMSDDCVCCHIAKNQMSFSF